MLNFPIQKCNFRPFGVSKNSEKKSTGKCVQDEKDSVLLFNRRTAVRAAELVPQQSFAGNIGSFWEKLCNAARTGFGRRFSGAEGKRYAFVAKR